LVNHLLPLAMSVSAVFRFALVTHDGSPRLNRTPTPLPYIFSRKVNYLHPVLLVRLSWLSFFISLTALSFLFDLYAPRDESVTPVLFTLFHPELDTPPQSQAYLALSRLVELGQLLPLCTSAISRCASAFSFPVTT